MAYTPRSGRSQTRYSTPEPDLDDHRNQPESLPTVTEPYNGRRRGTLASIASAERPQHESAEIAGPSRPTMDQLDLPRMAHYDSIARDFEHAVDDKKSIKSFKSNRSGRSNASRKSADERWHDERRGSNASPVVARRTTFRRAIHNRQKETGHESRNSSSDRSTSPPNSVDAFAHPPPQRPRGRAGTANSKVPSVDNLTINRSVSNVTRPTRRPTVGEDNGTAGGRTDVASIRSSVADDVCFPPEDPPNTYTIDFEDLEEFVAQTHTKTPVAHPFAASYFDRKACQQQRVFHDLRNGSGAHAVPADGLPKYATDDETIIVDEKKGELESSDEELTRAQSAVEVQNRFTFFSSEIDETVHAPELGGLLMPGETFRDIFELGPEGGVWWLDMLNPSEEEISTICGAFRVHPLTREDITTQETREKVELFRSYYFLCFRSFNAIDPASEDYLEPINIYAVVFREGLLTFSFCQNPHAAHVRKRIGRLRDYVNLSSDWICYALIDEIVDAFAPELRDLEQETDTIEDSVFTVRFEDSRAILKQIGGCRKKVMAMIRLLGGKADVIRGFAKKCNESYAVAPRGDVGLYLSDVQDHVVTMMSNLGHYEKMLSRSHGNHLSQISLNHIEQGTKGNELLGKITVVATILVPLNLIAGLFGMNVHVPGEGSTGLGWWFGIVGVILAFTVSCVLIAKRMKYI